MTANAEITTPLSISSCSTVPPIVAENPNPASLATNTVEPSRHLLNRLSAISLGHSMYLSFADAVGVHWARYIAKEFGWRIPEEI
jgi:hypothetical protein